MVDADADNEVHTRTAVVEASSALSMDCTDMAWQVEGLALTVI